MSGKSLKLFTATAVAASVFAPVASANTTFKDITPVNSHYDAVQKLIERGIINGYEDGTFRPNASLTRGQAAKILANTLNLDTSSKELKFKDVTTESGYIGAINALVNAGIINGYEDNTYKPNAPLTRGQMAKVLVNAFGLEKSTSLSHKFKDVSNENGYKFDIQTLIDHSITQGKTDTTYAPAEAVTRGQMATFVIRAENAKAKMSADDFVTLHIQSIKGTTLKTAEGIFEINSSLQSVFSDTNNTALANAIVKATVEENRVTAVESLQIASSGTAEKSVVLDGQSAIFDASLTVTGDFVEVKNIKIAKDITAAGLNQSSIKLSNVEVEGAFNIEDKPEKVASISPVANTEISPNYVIENSKLNKVNIARNLSDLTLTGTSTVSNLSVANNVQELTLNGEYNEVSLLASDEIKLTGNATISKLVSKAAISIIDILGTVKSLEITNPLAKVTLNPKIKISNLVLPTAIDIASVITNYNEVRGNIEAVNNTTSSSDSNIVTTPGGETIVTPKDPEKPEEPSDNEDSNTEKPVLPEVPLDPGDEQLADNKPILPAGDLIEGKISNVSVTTGDSSTVTTEDTVKVNLYGDTQIYKLAPELLGFFRNNQHTLSDANVEMVIKEGRIIALKNLILNNTSSSTPVIQGGGITIYGDLKVVNNQIEKLSNIIVTGNVILAANRTENLEIAQTKVFGKVEFESKATLAMRTKFASLTPFAAATTRIKITFTDSTVAIIEVRKADVELHTGGTTEVANIRLFANAEITSDLTNEKILPKIVIGQGVTNVKLNASIAKVVIESNEDVVVGGEGNFENVVVNTSKEVAINTVGTIGNLDIKKDNPKIKLGEEVKSVAKVTTILPVEEVFQNFDDLKGKIGQVILPEISFFAAELIANYRELGYYTIKLAGAGNYKVKYSLVNYEDYWNLPEIERNVDYAPKDALTYNVGEQIFIPANKRLFVYTVDDSNIIKDYKKDFDYGDSIRFTSTETGTKIESTFDVLEGSKVSDIYKGIFNFNFEQPIVYLGASTIDAYTWTKEGNLVSFIVPGTDKITLSEDDKEINRFSLDWNVRKVQGYGYSGRYSGGKATALKVIKEIYSRSIKDPAPSDMLAGPINLVFHAELKIKDEVVDRSNGEQYRSAVEKATTLEELYELIVEVNQNKNK